MRLPRLLASFCLASMACGGATSPEYPYQTLEEVTAASTVVVEGDIVTVTNSKPADDLSSSPVSYASIKVIAVWGDTTLTRPGRTIVVLDTATDRSEPGRRGIFHLEPVPSGVASVTWRVLPQGKFVIDTSGSVEQTRDGDPLLTELAGTSLEEMRAKVSSVTGATMGPDEIIAPQLPRARRF